MKNHLEYHTCAIITLGFYTFYLLFEVHLCTVTFDVIYGQYSRAGYSGTRTVPKPAQSSDNAS